VWLLWGLVLKVHWVSWGQQGLTTGRAGPARPTSRAPAELAAWAKKVSIVCIQQLVVVLMLVLVLLSAGVAAVEGCGVYSCKASLEQLGQLGAAGSDYRSSWASQANHQSASGASSLGQKGGCLQGRADIHG
jgi:hypothetical protein